MNAKSWPIPILLLAAAALLLGGHLRLARPALDQVLPVSLHEYEVELSFEGFGGEVRLATFLPAGDERQTVIAESFEQGPLSFSDEATAAGRQAQWSGRPPDGQHRLRYGARLSMRAMEYELPSGLGFGTPLPDATRRHLEETVAIPYRHPEIRGLWSRIRPAESADQVQVLRAIFDYTHDKIEPAPFKGYTDALTALRLGQASCNGKSRLFVALARLNGIPSRLVGGVILEPGVKQVSHQWVEAYLAGHWVPFDPLNGHFARIPADYLSLYRGDEFLFTHTRDVNFDHLFRIRRVLAPARAIEPEAAAAPDWLAGVARFIAANEQLSGVFLLFPLAALIVTFCRNVVGLRTFGVFLPMLVAAGCVYTGLLPGLAGFVAILGVGAAAHRWFRGMRVLIVPRIAAVITVLTALILAGGVLVTESAGHRLALLALFPVVILSFAAERLQEMMEHSRRGELLRTIASTLVVTVLCYLAFSSALLRGLFFRFPELLLAVLAAQLAVGRWTGIRASEFFRFLRLFRAAGDTDAGVLGINTRNIHFVSRLNAVHWMTVANDKQATKRHLEEAGVPTPRTLLSVESEIELDHRRGALVGAGGFALKPASGSQGQGIVLFAGADGDHFRLLDGRVWSYPELRAHVRDIARGLHGGADEPDRALFEELIQPDAFSRSIAPAGIPDLRVLVVCGRPVAAMLRVPTQQSGGRANLHQGAAGFAVDIGSGRIGSGTHQGRAIDAHPDSRQRLAGLEIPRWSEVLQVAQAAQRAVPLGYAGVDICLDARRGPVVLEINARPGIEIQNALQKGLLPELRQALAGGT
ncbi:MAG: sugar-transfer associated ATP-grasp domain-containing protein [Gammaproteobacteria bacterium]